MILTKLYKNMQDLPEIPIIAYGPVKRHPPLTLVFENTTFQGLVNQNWRLLQFLYEQHTHTIIRPTWPTPSLWSILRLKPSAQKPIPAAAMNYFQPFCADEATVNIHLFFSFGRKLCSFSSNFNNADKPLNMPLIRKFEVVPRALWFRN